MKKLIAKLIFLFVLVVAVLALLTVIVFAWAAPQFGGEYTGVISHKIERAESIDEPKIVLVGNSNLAFGIDSKRIEEALDMPVVNMGGHGGLGNEFHINMGKNGIGEGDIVVVAMTSYGDKGGLTPDLAWIAIENHGLWDLIPEDDRYEVLKAYPHYAFRTLGRWITGTGNKPNEGVYSIESFNEYGDIVYVRDTSPQANYAGVSLPPELGETVELVNEYAAWCAERGATCVVAAYPVITNEKTPPDAEAFDTFTVELTEALNCPVISDFKDYFLDCHYFYDTVYHLNDEGVAIRTEQLIEDLRTWKEKGALTRSE